MALSLSISIQNVFDAPAPPMAPQISLLGSPALQGSFAHFGGFSPFPHCLSCLVKHSRCSLSHSVQWHHCHLHFGASAGLCADTSLSPVPWVWLSGGSGCATAAALPVLLYPPSLHLPMATARCAGSARAPFQQQLPFSSFQAPQHGLALALGRREFFLPARLLSPAWRRLSTSPRHGCQGVVHFPYNPLQNLLLNAGAGNKR